MDFEEVIDLIWKYTRAETALDIALGCMFNERISETYIHFLDMLEMYIGFPISLSNNKMYIGCSTSPSVDKMIEKYTVILKKLEENHTKPKIFHCIVEQEHSRYELLRIFEARFKDIEIGRVTIELILKTYFVDDGGPRRKVLQDFIRISEVYQTKVEEFYLEKIYSNNLGYFELLEALTEEEITDDILLMFMNEKVFNYCPRMVCIEILWGDGLVLNIFSKHDNVAERYVNLNKGNEAIIRFTKYEMYDLVIETATLLNV